MIFALGTLIGWLVYELKDFFTNGGYAHALAYNLLKIIFILVCTLVMGVLTFAVKYFPVLVTNIMSLGKNQVTDSGNTGESGSSFKKPLTLSYKKYIRKNSY